MLANADSGRWFYGAIYRPNRRRRRLRWGVAAVELAILLPLLCFLFVIAVDFARVFYFSMTVANCARNGAIYGSQDPLSSRDTTGIDTAARRDASNLDSRLVNVSSATDNAANPNYVDVTVTYPFTTITRYPGVPSQMTLSRTVRMLVTPLTPN